MAIVELIAKIKPKNNGDFKLVDSIDVEMTDGRDLQTYIDDIEGGGAELYLNTQEPTKVSEDIIWIDKGSDYEGIMENPIVKELINIVKDYNIEMNSMRQEIISLKARVKALEENKPVTPSPSVTITNSFLLEDGTPLLLEEGIYFLYEEENVNEEDKITITNAFLLEDRTPFLLESGEYLKTEGE